MKRVPLPVIGFERPLVRCTEYAKLDKGFVPRALRRAPAATARTARAARRRAVARKARI